MFVFIFSADTFVMNYSYFWQLADSGEFGYFVFSEIEAAREMNVCAFLVDAFTKCGLNYH